MNRIELLQKHLVDSPDDPFLYFAMAKEHEKINELEEALKYYNHLLSSHPEYLGTYYHAGKIYEILTQWERALTCYDLGMKLATDTGDRHQLRELQEARSLLENRLLSENF